MGEAVHVGASRLLGEVISVSRDRIVAQVYGDTTGLRPGDRWCLCAARFREAWEAYYAAMAPHCPLGPVALALRRRR